MKRFLHILICLAAAATILQAQHYAVSGNDGGPWDLKTSTQYNLPCGLSPWGYYPNPNTGRLGLKLQHFNTNGSISAEFQYATNDPNYENIMISRLQNLSNNRYLVAGVVEVSAANPYSNGYVMLLILDPVTGNVLNSKAIRVPNALGNKVWVSDLVLNGNTVYIVGSSGTNTPYNNQMFVVKAGIDLTTNTITANWVRSYYTAAMPFNGPQPAIAYDGQTARVFVVQPDTNGKLLLFGINPGNGAIVTQRIGNMGIYKVKAVKMNIVKIGTIYQRFIISLAEDNTGNTILNVAKTGVSGLSYLTQKTYPLPAGKWTLTSSELTATGMLIGAVRTTPNISQYNWLQFNVNNCNSISNRTYNPDRQTGLSVQSGTTVFSLGAIKVPSQPAGVLQLAAMMPNISCESAFSINSTATSMSFGFTNISNGLNVISPIVDNLVILKQGSPSSVQIICQ